MSTPVLAVVVWLGAVFALLGLWCAFCLLADRRRRRTRDRSTVVRLKARAR